MYRKKKKRVWIWLAVLLVVIAAGCGYAYYYNGQTLAVEVSGEEEPVPEEDQELCYVHIDKLLGNEMTGTIMEEDGEETKETGTWMIPVGTDVVTKLGTTTTFARLASGDTIKMLMQQMDDGSEEILKIWITDLTGNTDNRMSGDGQHDMPGGSGKGIPGGR